MTKSNLLSVLRAIGGLSTDGLLLFEVPRNTLEYVNDGLLRMFDISHESFRHQPAFFLNHIIPEDIEYLRTEYDILIYEQKKENIEFRIKSHDGNLKDISLNAYVLENGKYIVAILKDITEIRQHEDYIINYGAKKNTLLEMVTHNLSGPLTISKNMIESLENVVKGNNVDNIHAHIQLIKENTSHCIELVTDFIEEEHLVSETIYTKKNRFEIIAKLNTIIERYRKSYPDYRFEVKKDFDSIYINNDDVKFLQVVNNLISNALKWSPAGSVIEIILEDVNDTVCITVKDYGIGIPDELKQSLFQKHTPASRKGLRGEKSIGMGLYIVKKLARLMDGTIFFESKENVGSSFTLKLPKEDAQSSIASQPVEL